MGTINISLSFKRHLRQFLTLIAKLVEKQRVGIPLQQRGEKERFTMFTFV